MYKYIYFIVIALIAAIPLKAQITIAFKSQPDGPSSLTEMDSGAYQMRGFKYKTVSMSGTCDALYIADDSVLETLDLYELNIASYLTLAQTSAKNVILNSGDYSVQIIGCQINGLTMMPIKSFDNILPTLKNIIVKSQHILFSPHANHSGDSTIPCIITGVFDLSNVVLKENSVLQGLFQDTIDLTNLRLENDATFDLTKVQPVEKNKKIVLKINNAPIDQLKLIWGNFKLDWSSDSSDEAKISTYLQLRDNFQKHNYLDSYKAIDIEYQNWRNKRHYLWGNIINTINLLWWDFGYQLYNLIACTVFILLFLTLINCIGHTYANMQKSVYHLENFHPYRCYKITKPNHPTRHRFDFTPKTYSVKWKFKKNRRFYYSLIYTSAIFFMINIRFEKVHYNKIGGLIWFSIIYLTGIICLAFIVNFIFK